MNRRLASISSMLSSTSNEMQNDPSIVWSTAHVPGLPFMRRMQFDRNVGRRQLYLGSIALGFTLAMHVRIPAKALTDESILFLLFLCLAVGALASPLRHFEVYTGQWSLSGPGRAFRIVPMLDGVGIAMCLYCIFRAICCCCIASVTALYVLYSVSDGRLPYTYCRNFDLVTFEPEIYTKAMLYNFTQKPKEKSISRTFVGHTLSLLMPERLENLKNDFQELRSFELEYCNVSFGDYSILYNVPAYNFFFIEVMQIRPNAPSINKKLLITCVGIWLIIWARIIIERLTKGKMKWNTHSLHVLIVPCVWLMLLIFMVFYHLMSGTISILSKPTHATNKDMISIFANSMIVAMYIHSAGSGTELIHGKGLNIFANGHIDPLLHSEVLIQSLAVLIFATCHAGGAAVCNMLEYPLNKDIDGNSQNVLWMIPLYSKCTLVGQYSHFVSATFFLGLTFSYMVIAYVLLKSSLHALFEYQVKLVYIDQYVVAGLIIPCMLLSMTFSTRYGLYLLESTDELLTGLAMPFICLLELVALIYLYRRRDFKNDMILATFDNTCSTRISTQWKIIPTLVLICLILKMVTLSSLDFELKFFLYGLIPLCMIFFSVPIRTCYNAILFLRQPANTE